MLFGYQAADDVTTPLHVLPSGFHRIRHYGLFAGTVRARNIERARLRIPRQSGRGFRFDVGRRSDLIPATIPK